MPAGAWSDGRFAVEQRIGSVKKVKGFDADAVGVSRPASTLDRLVFAAKSD
jgi:hypothetical protein